jgi:hypothetical protein
MSSCHKFLHHHVRDTIVIPRVYTTPICFPTAGSEEGERYPVWQSFVTKLCDIERLTRRPLSMNILTTKLGQGSLPRARDLHL